MTDDNDALSRAAKKQEAELKELNIFIRRANVRKLSLSSYGGLSTGVESWTEEEALAAFESERESRGLSRIAQPRAEVKGGSSSPALMTVGEARVPADNVYNDGVAESKGADVGSPESGSRGEFMLRRQASFSSLNGLTSEFSNFMTSDERERFFSMLAPADREILAQLISEEQGEGLMHVTTARNNTAIREQISATSRARELELVEAARMREVAVVHSRMVQELEEAQRAREAVAEQRARSMEQSAGMLVGWQECYDPNSQVLVEPIIFCLGFFTSIDDFLFV